VYEPTVVLAVVEKTKNSLMPSVVPHALIIAPSITGHWAETCNPYNRIAKQKENLINLISSVIY